MVTFIVTTCLDVHPHLYNNLNPYIISDLTSKRYAQYQEGVRTIIDFAKEIDARVIIVENNGPRETIFNSMGCEVLYTNNNSLEINNKGIKELMDVCTCLKYFNIPDDELIVKVTGRYKIDVHGQFCNALRDYNKETTDAIIRYGWYGDTSKDTPHDNCLTGLIAVKCKYIKEIPFKMDEKYCIEIGWANVTLNLDQSRVYVLKGLIGYRMYMWNTDDFIDL